MEKKIRTYKIIWALSLITFTISAVALWLFDSRHPVAAFAVVVVSLMVLVITSLLLGDHK